MQRKWWRVTVILRPRNHKELDHTGTSKTWARLLIEEDDFKRFREDRWGKRVSWAEYVVLEKELEQGWGKGEEEVEEEYDDDYELDMIRQLYGEDMCSLLWEPWRGGDDYEISYNRDMMWEIQMLHGQHPSLCD